MARISLFSCELRMFICVSEGQSTAALPSVVSEPFYNATGADGAVGLPPLELSSQRAFLPRVKIAVASATRSPRHKVFCTSSNPQALARHGKRATKLGRHIGAHTWPATMPCPLEAGQVPRLPSRWPHAHQHAHHSWLVPAAPSH